VYIGIIYYMLYYVYGSTSRASEKLLKSNDSRCVVRGERKRKHDFTEYFTRQTCRRTALYYVYYRLLSIPMWQKKSKTEKKKLYLNPVREILDQDAVMMWRAYTAYQYRYRLRNNTWSDKLTFFDLCFWIFVCKLMSPDRQCFSLD